MMMMWQLFKLPSEPKFSKDTDYNTNNSGLYFNLMVTFCARLYKPLFYLPQPIAHSQHLKYIFKSTLSLPFTLPSFLS
jgi:hypothetical protein